jgi:hypothetical protein
LGITGYVDQNPKAALSRQAALWTLSGVTRFAAGNGTGRIANAASPALGFGPVSLGPVLPNIVPGSRYLVWVWCWQTARNVRNKGFIAFINLKMPFVMVNAGPPLFIR